MKTRNYPVLIGLLICGGFQASVAAGDTQARTTTVPFQFTQSMIRVEVRLNGQGPFWMVLDTGANMSGLDRSVAQQLGLKLGKKQKLGEYYGSDGDVPTYQDAEVDRLAIGDLELREIPMVVTDLTSRLRLSTREAPIHGILGYSDVFHRRALRIDYGAQRLTFSPRSLISEEQEKLPPTPDRIVVPFSFRDGLLERLIGVHGGPKFRVRVNGKELHAQLDTGFNGQLALTNRATQELGLTADREEGEAGTGAGAGGALSYRRGQLEKVEIGALSVERPGVIFLPPSRRSGNDYGLNVGNGFLRSWIVTVDYRKKKLMFERPAARSEAAPSPAKS